ncbi:MAG: LamG domain-containing protein, partial [Lentisphaerota bacterium]
MLKWMSLFLLFILFPSIIQAVVIDQWVFKDTANGIIPSESGKNPATINDSAKNITFGAAGDRSFIELAGADEKSYVSLGKGERFNLKKAFTLEAVFRPVNAIDPQAYTMIIGKKYNRQFQLDWTFRSNGTIEFYVGGGDMKNNRVAKANLNGDKWMHIVATYDGTVTEGNNQFLYVNGELVSAIHNPVILKDDSGEVRIGQNSDSTMKSMINAQWNSVAIFDHAMTPEEIQKRYQSTNPGVKKMTVKNWKIPLDDKKWQLGGNSATGNQAGYDQMGGIQETSNKSLSKSQTCLNTPDGTRFAIQGNASQRALGAWKYSLGEDYDLSNYNYCLVRYRAGKLQRSVKPLAVISLLDSQNTTLLNSSEMVFDGKWHWLIKKIEPKGAFSGIKLEISTEGSEAFAELSHVEFSET